MNQITFNNRRDPIYRNVKTEWWFTMSSPMQTTGGDLSGWHFKPKELPPLRGDKEEV